MSLCCWIVRSVTGEYGTGMKALSCAWHATSFPPRFETTTLLVPTSIPTGCEPPLTRSSILSADSSGAFQRWSLFSAIGLSSACGARVPRRGFLGCLSVLGQLGQPTIVGPDPLHAHGIHVSPRRPGLGGERRLCRDHAGPRLA